MACTVYHISCFADPDGIYLAPFFRLPIIYLTAVRLPTENQDVCYAVPGQWHDVDHENADGETSHAVQSNATLPTPSNPSLLSIHNERFYLLSVVKYDAKSISLNKSCNYFIFFFFTSTRTASPRLYAVAT